MINRLEGCTCDCPSKPPYENPEEDYVLCVGFSIEGTGTGTGFLYENDYSGTWTRGSYSGHASGTPGPGIFYATLTVSSDRIKITITIVGGSVTDTNTTIASYEYDDLTSTLRFPLTPAMVPITLNKVFGDSDWPSTLLFGGGTCPEALPMNCCDTCDPVTCGYVLELDCTKGPIDAFSVGTGTPGLGEEEEDTYINRRITFRQCDEPGCLYHALGPTRSLDPVFPGFCDKIVGLDFSGSDCIINRGQNVNCRNGPYQTKLPCRWSDYALCSQDYLPAITWACASANDFEKWIELDIAAGTIRDTGQFAAHGLPSFPDFDLLGTWDCYGCNKFQILPNQSNEWKIPDVIELRAITENATGKCNVRQSVSEGDEVLYDPIGACGAPAGDVVDGPLVGYGDKEQRCNCCDPGCECFGVWVTISEAGVEPPLWQRRSTNACQPGQAAKGTAVGPTREAFFTFFRTLAGTGTGSGVVELPVGVVLYCDGSPAPDGWWVDWYVDGEFFETTQLTSCCCPFGLGGTGSELTDLELPGQFLNIAVGEGCGGYTPPECYLGFDEFEVPIEICELDIDEILTFVRISPMCWEFAGLISCDRFLRIRICCVSGSLIAAWFFPTACPQNGICTVTGNPEDGITLDCFDGVGNGCVQACATCIPDQPMWVICDDCSESTMVTPCVGGGNGLSGRDGPYGPTYGACATLCGFELCLNWYYSCTGEGIQWKFDAYMDGIFCGTYDITHSCCPLVLGTASGDCPDTGCCVGTEPCDITVCCCEGVSLPGTVVVSDGTDSITLNNSGANRWTGTGDIAGCTNITVRLQCSGVSCEWILLVDLTGNPATSIASSANCDPFELHFLVSPSCNGGNEVELTVTA